MTRGIDKTAYPRLKKRYQPEELRELFSFDEQEKAWVLQQVRGKTSIIGLACLWKSFRVLGYWEQISRLPAAVPLFIAQQFGYEQLPNAWEDYDQSGSRKRHVKLIRERLEVKALNKEGRQLLYQEALQAARTRERLSDIINVMLEILTLHRYELPGFSTLERIASKARHDADENYFRIINEALPDAYRQELHQFFEPEQEEEGNDEPKRTITPWQRLKNEPQKPSVSRIKVFLAHYQWLKPLNPPFDLTGLLPFTKYKHFAYQAIALTHDHALRLRLQKRTALTAILISYRCSGALDDLTVMLIKRIQHIYRTGRQAYDAYFSKQKEQVDAIIAAFYSVLTQEASQSIEEVLGQEQEKWKQQCNEYLAYSDGSAYPFWLKIYRSKRRLLFALLEELPLRFAGKETFLSECIHFIGRYRSNRKEWLEVDDIPNLDWLPEKARKHVTGKTVMQEKTSRIHARYFEITVFFELSRQLKSLDMYVEGSRDYADYRRQLVDDKTLAAEKESYTEMIGIPMQADLFVQQQQQKLRIEQQLTEESFPGNAKLRAEDNRLIIGKPEPLPASEEYDWLDARLKERMQLLSMTELLTDAEKRLQLHIKFGPLSGFESKLEDPRKRFIASLFCYGCNIGPTETSRSLQGSFSRKQIAWVNSRHVTEIRLEEALTSVINAYNKYELAQCWGRGESASADGTKWNLYENNLFSEYHIRYGGYGGIGYYHVADNYIALFSRFIPCGVYEARHILDGLLENKSDIQPDKLHGDTHSQSETVFALAYLLGIKLMPRIKELQDLTFYSPDTETSFCEIEEIKTGLIDWNLIETYFEEMLRVALSVKKGKISASAVLGRLGHHNRKNKLYFAFRELGRVIRSQFSFEYIRDEKLRALIQAETNKSEAYNAFTKWIAFGNKGVIAENQRHEQQKVIKYNQLAANLIILYNVNEMSRVICELAAEGHTFKEETLQALSPYRTDHINRFGTYHIDIDRPGMQIQTKLMT